MLNPIADRSMVAKGAADIGDRQKFDQLTPELDCIKHAPVLQNINGVAFMVRN